MDSTKNNPEGSKTPSVGILSAKKKEILFHGIPASPGIVIGSVCIRGKKRPEFTDVVRELPDGQSVEAEIALFKKAQEKTCAELRELEAHTRESLNQKEAGIFSAHLLIASDPMISTEVINTIRKQRIPASVAFRHIVEGYITSISSIPDQYLQERADDIRDVANRMLNHINGFGQEEPAPFTRPVIVIARDLTPSDTASMDRSFVLGFAIETGSPTSHTAILARSMKIPAVVGMHRIVERLADGDQVIIDGYIGMVIIHPDPETVAFYEEKLARQTQLFEELEKESRMVAETTDGFRIQLSANVEDAEHIDVAMKEGADGVGLFRTEYLFLNKDVMPDEETQFQSYKKLAETMHGQSVIIRTLDVGGDKLSAQLSAPREPNPFLGLRAIRLCMSRPELMYTQMRAVLRASAFGRVKILFPMISSMSELDALLMQLDRVKQELTEQHRKFDENMEIGVMIEIPSAVLIADQLAKKVDFFSIGSNDLTQYTLAVDRSNENVAYLYNAMHPAVIELIDRTIRTAHENGIWVGCCGELAGDPRFVALFAGLGIDELSMSPASLAPVRRIVRRLSMMGARALAREVLKKRDPAVTAELCQKFLARYAPDIEKMNKGF